MRHFIFFLLLMPAIALSGAWQPLFNGQTLDGWIVKTAPQDTSQTFWRVVDGVIEANSLGSDEHDYVWLLTENEYGDFELQFEFQAFRNSPGNSGVQIRSRYDDEASWLDGPQIDIHPPDPWRTGMMWDETSEAKGWLTPKVPDGEWVTPDMAVPKRVFYYVDDEPAWNTMSVRAEGMHITATLNGVQILDYDGSGVLDDKIHQKYKVGQTGHIALQIHRNDELRIRFKDMKIKELN